jgi:hypothetical protein
MAELKLLNTPPKPAPTELITCVDADGDTAVTVEFPHGRTIDIAFVRDGALIMYSLGTEERIALEPYFKFTEQGEVVVE